MCAVPDDVAVAGFDDLPQAAETSPPLTTMRQDTGRLGIEATQRPVPPAQRQRCQHPSA